MIREFSDTVYATDHGFQPDPAVHTVEFAGLDMPGIVHVCIDQDLGDDGQEGREEQGVNFEIGKRDF